MKKLLGISLVALFAVSPMMANAATGDIINADPINIADADHGGAVQSANSVTTNVNPKWKLATSSDSDVNAASAGYVKGAYNAAIKAVNAVHDEAVAAQSAAAAASGAVAALDSTVGSEGGVDKVVISVTQTDGLLTAATAKIEAGSISKGALSATVQSSLDKADTALQSHQAITEGATNGTISVAGSDVAVHGLGTAAYTDSSAYATAAQGAKADTALQSHQTITEGATNGTISVAGSDVAVHGLGTAAYSAASAFDEAGAAASAAAGALNSAIDAINDATGSASSVSLDVSIASQTILANGLTVSVPTTASYEIMQEWGSDSATSATYALGGDSSVNVAGSATLAAFSTVASGNISGIDISYTPAQ